eukprot:Em0024g390a
MNCGQVPLCLPDPGDPTCQLMISYVLLTPKMLQFSVQFLILQACYTKEWEMCWKNPEHVQLYQFMAKDNVSFHTVVFPSFLLGAEDNHILLNHMSSTGEGPGKAKICTCTTRNALALEHIMISSDQQRLICKAGQEAR